MQRFQGEMEEFYLFYVCLFFHPCLYHDFLATEYNSVKQKNSFLARDFMTAF